MLGMRCAVIARDELVFVNGLGVPTPGPKTPTFNLASFQLHQSAGLKSSDKSSKFNSNLTDDHRGIKAVGNHWRKRGRLSCPLWRHEWMSQKWMT